MVILIGVAAQSTPVKSPMQLPRIGGTVTLSDDLFSDGSTPSHCCDNVFSNGNHCFAAWSLCEHCCCFEGSQISDENEPLSQLSRYANSRMSVVIVIVVVGD